MKLHTIKLLYCILIPLCSGIIYPDLNGLQNFINFGLEHLLIEEKTSSKQILSSYDFIIVGGGTAGCTLAGRLSENPNWTVLLIEAGGNENLIMDIPMAVHFLQGIPSINWAYRTDPSQQACLGMNNNQCNWPRGKVMGGSSVLNYMVHTRGNRNDYDKWAADGNTEWSYDKVLPYFRKFEDNLVKNSVPGYRGKGGPVAISSVQWKSSVANAFVKSGLEMGFPYVDYNGPTQVGVSYAQTTTKNGYRQSSNIAYLHSTYNRPNIHILKTALVTKVIINKTNRQAIGVKIRLGNRSFTIYTRREVILSAGAINSPQLLMLSGIGPREHLAEMGIPTIADLPVGYNLMDHIAAPVSFTTNVTTLGSNTINLNNIISFVLGQTETMSRGPLTSAGGLEAMIFVNTKDWRDSWPDIELIQLAGSIYGTPIFKDNFGIRNDLFYDLYGSLMKRKQHGFMMFPMTLRPKSRGRIKLRSRNPLDYPSIDANYYSHPDDIETAVRGIKFAIAVTKTKAFQQVGVKLYTKPLAACSQWQFGSDQYWECYARHFTLTIYHYSGTCKMGNQFDKTAVVDQRLRVKGISGLRVVDASIMPEIIAGHTNSPTFMIAEKGADIIKQDWS